MLKNTTLILNFSHTRFQVMLSILILLFMTGGSDESGQDLYAKIDCFSVSMLDTDV